MICETYGCAYFGIDCGGHQKSAWKLFEDALPAKKDVYDNSY